MKRHYFWWLLAIFIGTLPSCKTSRQGISSDDVRHQEVVVENHHAETYEYLSARLKIKITERDKEHLELYETASRWLGTPYRYGGASRSGTDCSGLVMQIYKAVYNKRVERNSAQIKEKNCTVIKKSQLRTGDLVFFATGKKNRINHVGIYLKDNKFIHASSSRGVMVNALDESYYRRTYVCSGRVKGR